jgi:serine/threonine protein kinase
VAIKVVDVDRLTRSNQKLKRHLDSEISIMKSLQHDHIVTLHEVFVVRRLSLSWPLLPHLVVAGTMPRSHSPSSGPDKHVLTFATATRNTRRDATHRKRSIFI